MKRADIKPGDEYLTCPTSNWIEERSYSHQRVLVLDNQPWAEDRFGGSSKVEAVTVTGEYAIPEKFRPASVSNGVLVRILDKASGEPIKSSSDGYAVMQLAAIRGPWADCWEMRNERIRKERERKERETTERIALQKRGEAAAEVIGGSAGNRFGASVGSVFLALDQAEKIAADIERLRQIDSEHGFSEPS